MKKFSSLIILAICFHFAKATNEVPNGGFENWTSGDPNNWSTSNLVTSGMAITQVAGYSGSYAVKGQSVVASPGDTFPPVLISGISGSYFPISQNYSTFEFYYQTNLASGDNLIASVSIVDQDNVPFGGNDETFISNTTGWTHATISIPYNNDSVATGASIQFFIQTDGAITDRQSPLPSSYFIIDDVGLTGLVSVKTVSRVPNLQVYPVPAHDHLTIKGQTDQNKAFHLVLTDATGRLVMEKNSGTPENAFIHEELNLQGIAPGHYSLAIMSDEKTSVRRIIVQ